MLATPRVASVITNSRTAAAFLARISPASWASVHSPTPICGLWKETPAASSRGMAICCRQVEAPQAPPRKTAPCGALLLMSL